MPTYPARVPVVIVGAGPTGLTTANLLAAYGIESVVLERERGPINLPRAIVLDDEGARTLQVFGLDETYVAGTMKAVGSRYLDDDGKCLAETGAGFETYGFPKRQYIYQPEFEEALRGRLDEQAPGTLFFNSEVRGIVNTGEGALVSVTDSDGRHHKIACDWVLACDGGRSPTRERLGIAMTGSTYAQDWIVLDMVNDPDASHYSKFYCSRKRPTVSVPAPAQGRRYEFMLLGGETREEVLEPAFLAKLLEPFRPYRDEDILRKTVYTFHARIAERFREGRILLLGDAAHLTPPFAGQGMNAGLRDAHNVAWKIAACVRGGADQAILDSYEAERRKPAWDMIQLAVTMGSFVMPAGEDQIMFRDLLLRALEPFPNVRDYLIQMRFKPKPRYQDGLFLDLDQPEFEASLVGEMIPQPRIARAGRSVLLDSRLGPGFGLIAQSAAGHEAASRLGASTFLGHPLAVTRIDGGEYRGASSHRRAADPVSRPLLTHRDQVMLVRPDRYCAAAVHPSALRGELARYESLFSAASRANSTEIEEAVAISASL